jgi:uncharacterized protein DUF397
MEQVDPRWRKASFSGNGANCVEAGHVPGAVLIRDTKDNRQGPVLRVSSGAWEKFTASLK